MTRDSRSVGFAVASRDVERLDRMAQRFAGGNRSAFLRMALDRMEAADRAERLRSLQAYGARRAAEREVGLDDIPAIVDRILRKQAPV
jgi:Arc/MetJ-type ribon-helix-helix transcriptional regulator